MHDLYVSEINTGFLFAAWAYLHSILHSELRKTMRYGRSRSFKIIEIGTNRKPEWHFLL